MDALQRHLRSTDSIDHHSDLFSGVWGRRCFFRVFHLESMDGMAKSKGLAFQSISGRPGKKGSFGGRALARAAESTELGTNLELHCNRDCVSAVYVHRDS